MLSIYINSSDTVRAHLDGLRQRMGDLSEVMDNIGMRLESRVSARFETRTDPNGDPWEPWAPSTKAHYPEDGNKRLLDRYGDMLDKLSYSSDATSATVGFGNPVATYHEWGTEHMPRRGMLFADPDAGTLGTDDEAEVLDILSAWIG